MVHSKANQVYRQDLVDVEVQMLSKLCKAVKKLNVSGSSSSLY